MKLTNHMRTDTRDTKCGKPSWQAKLMSGYSWGHHTYELHHGCLAILPIKTANQNTAADTAAVHWTLTRSDLHGTRSDLNGILQSAHQ